MESKNFYNNLYKINKYNIKLNENPNNQIYKNKIIYYENLIGSGKYSKLTNYIDLDIDLSDIEYYIVDNNINLKKYNYIYYPIINKKLNINKKRYILKDIYNFFHIVNSDSFIISIDNKINSLNNIDIFKNYFCEYIQQQNIVCKKCHSRNKDCDNNMNIYNYCNNKKDNKYINNILNNILENIKNSLKNKKLYVKNFFYDYIIDKDNYIDNVIIKKIITYLSYLFIISENPNKFKFEDPTNFKIFSEDNKIYDIKDNNITNDLYFICYCIVNLLFNYIQNKYKNIDMISKIIKLIFIIISKSNKGNNYIIFQYQQANTFTYIKTHDPINWYDKIFINGISKPKKNIQLPKKEEKDILECKDCLSKSQECPICNKRILLKKYEHLQLFYYNFYQYIYKYMFDPDVIKNYNIT